MEGFMTYPVEISQTQMMNLNSQPCDMFTGDSSFSGESPAEFPASPVESPASFDTDDDSVSDCESCVSSYSSSSSGRQRRGGTLPEAVVTEVAEDDRVHELIKLRFLSCLVGRAAVVSVHKRNWAGFTAQAKLQAFQIYSRAVAEKNGGNPNVKFAWFGGSRERVHSILSHGFSHLDLQGNNNKFGVGGLVLFPDNFPSQSVENAVADEDGLKYVLLCRVILGKAEVVQANSGQTHPSLAEYDSGIDDFTNPKKYIVWSTNMNVHVLPEYVVTFEAPQPSSVTGSARVMGDESHKLPTSPWISFPALIQVLGKFIPPNALVMIKKFHKDYKDRRISRPELISKVRQIAGDRLLVAVIKKVYRR